MTAPLDWYFDVISPFAYLQWRRLRRDHAGVALNPKPALAKQGVSFGLPHQLSAADVEVVNIFLEERVATGHVEDLIRKAVDQVLKASN